MARDEQGAARAVFPPFVVPPSRRLENSGKDAVVRDCLTDERIGAGHCDAILGFSSRQINQQEQNFLLVAEALAVILHNVWQLKENPPFSM